MKRVSPYLKMRVLGAIEFSPGESIVARIKYLSDQVFTDEDGDRFQFTWRTIQTWYSRYQKDGVTSMTGKPRSDSGHTRKVEPEQLFEAIEQVRSSFHGSPNVTAIYRACIERGLLERQQVAPNTFRRIVKKYELFKPETQSENKRRLAFAKAHANQLWQADTMCGPHVRHGAAHVQKQAHRLRRRRQPRLLSRRILPGRNDRDLDQGSAERALQARRSGGAVR